MAAILKETHDQVVKKIKRRAFRIHLCGILLVIGLLLYPYVLRVENDLVREAYGMVRGEMEAARLKQELLQVIRKKPLTLSQGLDILEAITSQDKIPIPIILAILEQESQFDPKAISKKGARGVGQLMEVTWKHYGNGTNVHDPLSNITASIAYLTDLYNRFGAWEPTLCAYAAGPTHATDKNLNWYSKAVLQKAKVYQAKIQ